MFRNNLIAAFVLAIATGLAAQMPDKIAVKFSNPERPGLLQAELVHGSITVKGYDGNEVTVEASNRSRKVMHPPESKRGMIRLNQVTTGLTVTEEDNEISINTGSHMRAVDLVIQVPRKTSLQVSTVNDGDIHIEGVDGEIEANNVNGEIKIVNVSGTVLSNTTNGDVTVTLNRVTPDKPMSFVSFNGDVDVTLPGTVKADVKLKSERGEIYSDFDIALEERVRTTKEDNRNEGGRFQLSIESAMYGKINGGGPEFHFSTFNGEIYIRKAK